MSKLRILIVDDEPGVRQFLKAALMKEHTVSVAAGGEEAMAMIDRDSFHLMITDQRMPRMTGIELLERVRTRYPEVSIIVLTAYGTLEEAVEAMKLGALDYITKPLSSPEELRLKIRRAAERIRLQNIIQVLEGDPDRTPDMEFIFEDPVMVRIVELCRRVGPDRASVLLSGESGTGKDVLARFIHRLSPRKHEPFVVVNCAAFSDTLIESELFGHEKGAFTGAHTTRPGRFETADGGTLFLDEIGEIPLSLQPKLLRALQERTFERLGSNRLIHVDVRILAATNRDLEESVRRGEFREDLYFRLNVFPIRVPPLRERKGDILPLVHHFLSIAYRHRGKEVPALDKEVQKIFKEYSWPGNVRELSNLIERLSIIHEGTVLTRDMIPGFVGTMEPPPRVENGLVPLEEVERNHILSVLRLCKGNRTHAAEVLGISLRTLQYRLKSYGLTV
ncbi:MAG TPA: sigma-54 dependent transcriptional regulator [Thermoanaerobaculia bacterium]|nr:sigma-54 dependent transcriptional regulator [Thermoanaerobaculia bacterium]HXK66945.1 sigma-54 dependent transcriptional regulator [Thermoanaerobaculia bacterium]